MNIVKKCNQIAVYWGSPTPSGRGGFTYASAIEIICRWEKKQQLFINDQGEQELSQAIVYVNQDVDVGGYLYLGEESELDSAHDDPEVISGAYRIKAYAKTTSLSATEYVRKVWL